MKRRGTKGTTFSAPGMPVAAHTSRLDFQAIQQIAILSRQAGVIWGKSEGSHPDQYFSVQKLAVTMTYILHHTSAKQSMWRRRRRVERVIRAHWRPIRGESNMRNSSSILLAACLLALAPATT